jgi:hypothetical protein
MYDPLIVDVFTATHRRVMPAESDVHPAARAVGGARAFTTSPAAPPVVEVAEPELPAPAADAPVLSEVLAVSSLARAMSGTASLSDVGALSWMTLRNVVPATAMVLFVEDERQDLLAVGYAAGANAAALRGLKKQHGSGIAGWAAVNRRGVLNADPSLDLGFDGGTLESPLRSSLTIPLVHDGRSVGVLSCYSTAAQGFTEDHLRLLELMSASLAASVASATGREAASAPRAVAGSSRKLTLVS